MDIFYHLFLDSRYFSKESINVFWDPMKSGFSQQFPVFFYFWRIPGIGRIMKKTLKKN